MADGLVVPDIVSGNILFKSIVWFGGGLAAGVVLGGAIPIVLTSRSDPPAARSLQLLWPLFTIEKSSCPNYKNSGGSFDWQS